jgi:hypothetical protein
MAKKTKRKVSSGISREPEILQTPTVETSAPVRATTSNRRVISATEFNPDYSYVISDLKRIGLLAGVFFVILIALSFIL